MRQLLMCLALAFASCIPTSPVAQAPRDPRTCFVPRQVDSFAAQGIDVVNIKVDHDYFRLALAEACPEIQESDRIQLVPRGGATNFVCIGETANANVIAYSKVTGPRRCLVKTMQRLTPAEVAGLSPKEKP